MNAEQVIWQLVKLFASHEDPTLKTKVAKLTQILVDYQPEFHRELSTKKKALEHAIQGEINYFRSIEDTFPLQIKTHSNCLQLTTVSTTTIIRKWITRIVLMGNDW